MSVASQPEPSLLQAAPSSELDGLACLVACDRPGIQSPEAHVFSGAMKPCSHPVADLRQHFPVKLQALAIFGLRLGSEPLELGANESLHFRNCLLKLGSELFLGFHGLF